MKRLLFVSYAFLMVATCYGKDILATTVRSGSHFLMYTINYLSDRKFEYKGKTYPFIDQYNSNLSSFIHEHKISHLGKDDKVVLATRNYREIFLFYYANLENKFFNPNIYKKLSIKKINAAMPKLSEYVHNLQRFDMHPEDRKLLIYYEDLMLKPGETISKLANFLGIRQEKATQFLQDLEMHKKLCLQKYKDNFVCQNRPHFHAHSNGKNMSFYCDFLKKDDLIHLDTKLKKYIPSGIYDKYLKRYSL